MLSYCALLPKWRPCVKLTASRVGSSPPFLTTCDHLLPLSELLLRACLTGERFNRPGSWIICCTTLLARPVGWEGWSISCSTSHVSRPEFSHSILTGRNSRF